MSEPDGDGAALTIVPSSAEVSAVIIRACARCSGPRQQDAPCARCGNPDPPQVTELGVVSAAYRSRWRRAWRAAVGEPLARRRISRANQAHSQAAEGS